MKKLVEYNFAKKKENQMNKKTRKLIKKRNKKILKTIKFMLNGGSIYDPTIGVKNSEVIFSTLTLESADGDGSIVDLDNLEGLSIYKKYRTEKQLENQDD